MRLSDPFRSGDLRYSESRHLEFDLLKVPFLRHSLNAYRFRLDFMMRFTYFRTVNLTL